MGRNASGRQRVGHGSRCRGVVRSGLLAPDRLQLRVRRRPSNAPPSLPGLRTAPAHSTAAGVADDPDRTRAVLDPKLVSLVLKAQDRDDPADVRAVVRGDDDREIAWATTCHVGHPLSVRASPRATVPRRPFRAGAVRQNTSAQARIVARWIARTGSMPPSASRWYTLGTTAADDPPRGPPACAAGRRARGHRSGARRRLFRRRNSRPCCRSRSAPH